MKQRVYIAGPITGIERQAVIDRFSHAERQLTLLGFRAVNPARHLSCVRSDGDSWGFWMRRCIAELMTCNAIMMLDGWQASRGARLEHRIASELGLAILTMDELSQLSEPIGLNCEGNDDGNVLRHRPLR